MEGVSADSDRVEGVSADLLSVEGDGADGVGSCTVYSRCIGAEHIGRRRWCGW